jgi:alpha-acetolactate decarboxylase
MFRTPENLSQIQVKYHAHFVSTDKTMGGHIMDLAGKNIMVEIAPLTNVNIFLRTQFVPVKNLKGGTEANQFDSVVEAGSGASTH